MGDRGNIVIEKDNSTFPHEVFFYTHWSGSELKPILQEALGRSKDRWTDGQYLSRVIFCQFIKDDPEGTTGYGISTVLCDNENPLLCVNIENQTVRELVSGNDPNAPTKQQWTFEQFINEKFTTE